MRAIFFKGGITYFTLHFYFSVISSCGKKLDMFTLRRPMHSYRARSNNKIDIRHVSLTKSQQTYFNIDWHIFSRLPISAATIDIKYFKTVF